MNRYYERGEAARVPGAGLRRADLPHAAHLCAARAPKRPRGGDRRTGRCVLYFTRAEIEDGRGRQGPRDRLGGRSCRLFSSKSGRAASHARLQRQSIATISNGRDMALSAAAPRIAACCPPAAPRCRIASGCGQSRVVSADAREYVTSSRKLPGRGRSARLVRHPASDVAADRCSCRSARSVRHGPAEAPAWVAQDTGGYKGATLDPSGLRPGGDAHRRRHSARQVADPLPRAARRVRSLALTKRRCGRVSPRRSGRCRRAVYAASTSGAGDWNA